MATKIRVQNFQSIKDAEINVDGFTVVTGSNNSGKTALQRAVRGVFENTRGHAFVRHGEKHSEVTVTFSNSEAVTWCKGKTTNRYVVNGKTLDKVGHGVPQEVLDLGVRPLTCGGHTIWPQVAPQFTGQVFLLDEVGSVLAEAVSDVERVTALNRALKGSERDKRSASSTLKVRKEDQKTLESQLLFYEGLEDVGLLLDQLEQGEKALSTLKNTIDSVKELASDYEEACDTAQSLLGVGSIVLPPFEEIENLSTDIDTLRGLLSGYERASELSSKIESLLSGVQEIDPPKDLERCRKGISLLRDLRDQFLEAEEEIKEIEEEILSQTEELEEVCDLLHTTLQENEVCPLCDSDVR